MAEDQAPTLLLEIKNALYPEATANVGSSVRLRSKPVMNKVKKVHSSAYMLANISRNLCSSIQESVLIVPLMAQIRSHLSYPIEFSSDGSGFCSFDEIQRRGMDNLKQALLRTIDKAQSTEGFLTKRVPPSRIKQISVSSVVNKRRRQEDRWFFEPDLVAYAPVDRDREANLSKLWRHDYPQIVGCGVFDGHGGPEAAEHCSNLAPFLLSRHLQQRFLETLALHRSSETIPDILARVIHELNFSVTECHRLKLWNSGTTATICLIHGDYIYTGWIGDSQGVLFGPGNNATKSTPPHQSHNKPIPQGEPVRLTETPLPQTAPSSALGTTTVNIPHIDEVEMAKGGKKHTPLRPLVMGSIEPPSTAASALISPTSPRTRAARWGLSFAWLTSLVRGSGGNSASSKESSPSDLPQSQLRVRAPLATQEVEGLELAEVEDQRTTPVPVPSTVVHSVARVPFRYGSLPIGKKKERQHNHHQQGTGGGGGGIGGVPVVTKRLSAHFSEPSLNIASAVAGATATVDPTAIALSAGHRISPAGDMRDSRSTSVVERSPDSPASAFSILTPHMHRPEYAVEFVSILRAGGCVTFKASEDYVGGGGGEEDDDESEKMGSSQPGRIPAPVMSSTQLLFVPDLSVSGTYRVGGISGVTRSLGASTSLIPGLSGLPSLSVHRLSVASCLILATDGLWDTYGCSPDDLTHFFSGTPNREFAKLLTARAVRNGSSDNVTTLILWLGGGGTASEPMEVDLRSPTAYPTGTRCASVPSLGSSRLRGPLAVGALGETDFTLPCYVEPQERALTRSHSSEDLADVDRIRASSPMRRCGSTLKARHRFTVAAFFGAEFAHGKLSLR
ncbi:Protein phosphatase 1L [Taenia solium]|eukprot:TsM_000198300 transcript=TsM_000198300 gene=TsM_000198300